MTTAENAVCPACGYNSASDSVALDEDLADAAIAELDNSWAVESQSASHLASELVTSDAKKAQAYIRHVSSWFRQASLSKPSRNSTKRSR